MSTQPAPTAPRLPDLTPDEQAQVVAKAFSALGDPTRMRIVDLLREHGEQTVSELTAALPVSQSRVSSHLACLSDCGFTTVRREGRRAHYRLADARVPSLVDAMRSHADAALPGLLACLQCLPATTNNTTDSDNCC